MKITMDIIFKGIVWLKWLIAQLVMFLAGVLGIFVLLGPCLFQAWRLSAQSIKDGRPIDEWKWSWLNYVYGNPEDGVSGQQAIVFKNGQPTSFLPRSGSRLRAFVWGALRNSCDNLKYVFANDKGPEWAFSFNAFRKEITIKLGYQEENGFKVPVFSVGF